MAALGGLRDLLQGDVGAAAQVLKALVGDVVIVARKVDGKKQPEMEARFTINGIQALASLERAKARETDDGAPGPWRAVCDTHPAGLSEGESLT
ncbi:MAG: hypothetical protein ACKOZU_12640 [Planctomycetaceae bacterium]